MSAGSAEGERVRPAGVRDGHKIAIGFKTSPQGVDWPTLDATWARAGELDIFDAGWLNDHLTHPGHERGGRSYESLTLMAALAHRVPGHWLVHGVLSNTFRHPAVLAKAATVLDHVTGGRFIVGLGAGWHAGEHEPFGLALPPIGERIDRLYSAVGVLRALFSSEASSLPGVTCDDPFYPLRGATNEPGPLQPGGLPIWLGGQKRRGLELAASQGDGWMGDASASFEDFVDRRERVLRLLEERGRDSAAFAFGALVRTGESTDGRREALATARRYVAAGANHIILGMPARLGPAGLEAAAREIADPLRAEFG